MVQGNKWIAPRLLSCSTGLTSKIVCQTIALPWQIDKAEQTRRSGKQLLAFFQDGDNSRFFNSSFVLKIIDRQDVTLHHNAVNGDAL